MRICLNQEAFLGYDDRTLLWTCIEPVIVKLRGRSYAFKSEFADALTRGQRALLMYEVLLGHASGGVLPFFENMSYLLVHEGFWAELRRGAGYFQDETLLRYITDLENLHGSYCTAAGELTTSGAKQAIAREAERLDGLFAETFAASAARIAARIRENPSDFVDFADQGPQ